MISWLTVNFTKTIAKMADVEETDIERLLSNPPQKS